MALTLTKSIASRLLPRRYRELCDTYHLYRNWYRRYRVRRAGLVAPLAKRLGFVVQGGPFAGMVYPREIVRADIGSVFFPKLLGCYELECQRFIERICRQSYRRVINIGAGEGYYAVGLARRLPEARVIAFEMDACSREFCRRLARLNGVENRVEVRGVCDREALAACLTESTVIICDCEGAEIDLLQPDQIRSLAQAGLLVELHDFVDAAISRTIQSRFVTTHNLERVPSCERNPRDWPILKELPLKDQTFLLSEHRPGIMEWLCAEPNDSSNSN
jgi:Met-10+ like-protein